MSPCKKNLKIPKV